GLTGLTNVRHFREQAQREHSRARRHNDPYSILMMDIDHFKKINDVYGHPMGDTVLREMAAIFREAVERKVFAAPAPLIRCTVSVGVADYLPGTEGTEKTVIGRADQALYSAKRGGRNRVVCSPSKDP
ncbi:MAG: GGDEF domain-containing protein, partial [Candidatus Deferrimicrobium sp.]|nr:GGDEF domain-containing protein [Candidatus Deferrimicrobium sp.]